MTIIETRSKQNNNNKKESKRKHVYEYDKKKWRQQIKTSNQSLCDVHSIKGEKGVDLR